MKWATCRWRRSARSSVSSDRGTSRTGSLDRDHEPAVLGMDAGVFESAPVQSPPGSHHRPGAHHRDRNRVLSFPQNAGGTAEKESLVAFRASTELSRGRDSGRRPFLGAPSRLSSDRTGGSVISTLEEKDSYDVGGAKSDGHGGAESSCQKQPSGKRSSRFKMSIFAAAALRMAQLHAKSAATPKRCSYPFPSF